jgi:glycosyltransferase involved in cell wall biosynthesis
MDTVTAIMAEPTPLGEARVKASGGTEPVSRNNRALLLLSSASYESAVTKGVVSLLRDFDERGFFTHVLIAFPLARTSSTVQLSERITVQDIGTDRLPGGGLRWLRRLLAPLHFVRIFAVLNRYVRTHSSVVIRATDPTIAGPIAWAIARMTGKPYCVSLHADFEKRHDLGGASAGATILGSRALARSVERFVIRRAELVMPIRESLRAYALASGARPDRIRIIPHGTDLTGFVQPSSIDVRRHFGVDPERKIVSFAGRIVRENYIDDVIAVARRLAAVRNDFVFIVAGGGTDEARVRAAVETDAVLRRIMHLVGFQPREIVAAMRQASAASLCLMGGFSLIEACAAASPVVSYDVEWHHELVRDGDTGFLVREHDLDALERVIGTLLDDGARGQKLGSAARASALANHDLEATVKIKRRAYLELLPNAGM